MIIDRPCTTCGYSLEKGVQIVALVDLLLGCLTVICCSIILVNFEVITAPSNNTVTQLEASHEEILVGDYTTAIPLKAQDDCDLILGNESLPNVAGPTANSSSKNNVSKITRKRCQEHKEIETDYTLEKVLLIIVLVSAVIQVLMISLLYLGLKKGNILSLEIWLIISGFSCPATGFLLKMYEMIVVFSYSEELKGQKHSHLLEEFRKLPYVCSIQTQIYPPPNCGMQIKEVILGDVEELSYNETKEATESKATLFQSRSFIMNMPGTLFSAVNYKQK